MTESIPTTWNDERDAEFFAIADTWAADGFADNATLTAQIERMLEDLVAAESWESMAKRAVASSKPDHRGLVLVPVPAPRRAAS
jgi:hypothetical protein